MTTRFPTPAAVFRSAVARARAAVVDAQGTTVIEFAFLARVMLTMLGMCVVVGEALAIGQKVTSTARTVTDIVSQNTVLSTTQMSAILDASSYTMAPYPSANLSIVVSEIQTNAQSVTTNTGTVTWTAPVFNGVGLTLGSTVTLPAGMSSACNTPTTASACVSPNASATTLPNCPVYIYGQVNYSFTPPIIGSAVSGPINLSDVSYWSPRKSPTVLYPCPD